MFLISQCGTALHYKNSNVGKVNLLLPVFIKVHRVINKKTVQFDIEKQWIWSPRRQKSFHQRQCHICRHGYQMALAGFLKLYAGFWTMAPLKVLTKLETRANFQAQNLSFRFWAFWASNFIPNLAISLCNINDKVDLNIYTMARRATLSVTYDKSSKFYSMFGIVMKCHSKIHLVKNGMYLTVVGRIKNSNRNSIKICRKFKTPLAKKGQAGANPSSETVASKNMHTFFNTFHIEI